MRERKTGGGTCRRRDTGASEIAKTHTINAHTHTQSHQNGEGDKRFNGEGQRTHSKDTQDRGSCGSASVGAGGERAPNGGGSVSRVCKATVRSFICDGCECLRPLLSTLHCAPCHVRRANSVRWKATHLRAAWREPSRRGCCLSTCRRGVQQRCVDNQRSQTLFSFRSRHNSVKRTSSRPLYTTRAQRSRSQTPSRQALQNE